MSLEEPYNGAIVGATFLCLIGDQFARLRLGDRYFYDLDNQSGSFTQSKHVFITCYLLLTFRVFPGQLNEIRKTSLAKLICDNTKDIDQIQPLALELPNNAKNPITSCNKHLGINLSFWREK